MTDLTTHTNLNTRIADVSFQERLLAALLWMGKISPTYRRLEYYNTKTDDELAAMGMTRADVVYQVLGVRAHF